MRILSAVTTDRGRRQIDESYRYRAPHRRSWPRGDPQGDPPDHADPGGRPVTDYIGMVGKLLLWYARSGKADGIVSITKLKVSQNI